MTDGLPLLLSQNWGRQNTQSLQAVLAVAPLKKEKHWEMLGHFVCLSVCLSRTICVCTGEKWFRTFVRGTVRTENEIVSVCVSLSSTICVYRTAKWFNPFVRGTFETDSQYNLEKRTATVLVSLPTLFQC